MDFVKKFILLCRDRVEPKNYFFSKKKKFQVSIFVRVDEMRRKG